MQISKNQLILAGCAAAVFVVGTVTPAAFRWVFKKKVEAPAVVVTPPAA